MTSGIDQELLLQTRIMAREGTPVFKFDDLDDRVGERLRAHRERLGLSRQGLSNASGISRSTIAHLERGDQRPLPGTLRRLAASLAVPLHALAPDWDAAEHGRPKSGYEHPGVGLRTIRRSKGLTQAALAAAVGVNTSTISRLERGLHATRKVTSRHAPGLSHNDQLGLVSAELAEELGFPSAAALTRACAAIEDE